MCDRVAVSSDDLSIHILYISAVVLKLVLRPFFEGLSLRQR